MNKFCIKKNAGSVGSPWLSTFRAEPMYSSLDYLTEGIASLIVFPTAEAARNFIKEQPKLCDELCVVCEATEGADGRMFPVQ